MKKWMTLAFLCLAFFFYMSDRQLFGLLVPLIQQETGLSKIQIGFIDTAMYWVIAIMMPFSGFAGDRWPRTRVITCAIFGWGAMTLLTGFVGGLVGFVLLRSVICTGVQTFYGPSAYALMADEHKATRTTALSLHQGAMYTGMLVSGALVAVILSRFGSWRWVYFLFGGATILVGVALAKLIAPPIGQAASAFGILIDRATKLQPFWMGIAVSVLVGVALTLPISSAAICSVLGLTGLAGGAAVAGCCAQMVGFAVISFRENRWGGLVSQGLGTSMLQMPTIVKNPRVWIAPILTSAVTGPMATCGLCGPIGVWTGWLSPSAEAAAKGAQAIAPAAMDWLGLALICIVLPAVLCPLIHLLCRRLGWVKDGDLALS